MALLIMGLILFVLLIVVHEYGHFLVAKRNGVEVEEFGVGFPPKIYGRKLGKGIFEGYYTINLLPLGGFVKLKGEHDADKTKGAYGSVSTSAKLRIMLAGVAMNFIVAIFMFTFVAWVGMPQLVENQFTVASDTKIIKSNVISGGIVNDSPAMRAGLETGDIITKFNGEQILTEQQLNILSSENAGNKVAVDYTRKGTAGSTTVQLMTKEESVKYQEKSYLGVVLEKGNSGVTLVKVLPNSVASGAGLLAGDQITQINDVPINAIADLRTETKQNEGKTVKITYLRNNESKEVTAKLLTTAEVENSSANPYFGFSPSNYQLNRSTWSAPIVAFGLSGQFTWLTLKGLGSAIAHLGQAFVSAITGNGQDAKQEASAASENVSGPVGIYAILQQGSSLGYQFILFVVALISLTLAIMNLLPIPALDGGRAFVTLLFRAMKKPLLPKTEELIHGTGFAALMILFVVITIVDVKRFF